MYRNAFENGLIARERYLSIKELSTVVHWWSNDFQAHIQPNEAQIQPNEAHIQPNKAQIQPNKAQIQPNEAQIQPIRHKYSPLRQGRRYRGVWGV
jgi:hypothetical protein